MMPGTSISGKSQRMSDGPAGDGEREAEGSPCSDCGCPSRLRDRFCRICGSVLRHAEPSPALENQKPTRHAEEVCPGCGAHIAGNAQICEECGLTLELRPADDFAESPAVGTEYGGEMDRLQIDSLHAQPLRPAEGTCPGCSESISDQADGCLSCGLVFKGESEDEISVCPTCGIPANLSTRCCPECGRTVC
jgi:predicted amidophosphoribosyltransferase